METKKSLTKWDFAKELKVMAVSCIGLKQSTAERKASNIFKKYQNIIAYSESDQNYNTKRHNEKHNMFLALKTGAINYKKGKNNGKILIRDIEQVEIRENDVLLITKYGREITMSSDFKYLIELFN